MSSTSTSPERPTARHPNPRPHLLLGAFPGESRPDLLHLEFSTDLLVERVTLRNSPHFHVKLSQCARDFSPSYTHESCLPCACISPVSVHASPYRCLRVIIRYVHIDVDRFAQRSVKVPEKIEAYTHDPLRRTLILPLSLMNPQPSPRRRRTHGGSRAPGCW